MTTLGEQLNEHTEKQLRSPDKQEAGETTNEAGKGFMENLAKAIGEARSKGIRGRIYVHVIERPLQFARNAVKQSFIVRRSRPTPEQCTYLFSHDDGDVCPKFEYCLPELSHVPWILSHKDQYTTKYLRDINDWLRNQLV